ncbi:hypothetical protein HanPI659440_Chr07g0253951 [Helianthus annuus]|nr:hypothetical protein HanPI659440_Chr07g0253951 [Helianthus annuus]
MEGDHFISRLMLRSCNLSAPLAEGVTRFRKGMQECEEVTKKKDKMKASMAFMKKEIDSFAKKEKAWVKKMQEVTSRHEVEVEGLKKEMEALKVREKTSLKEQEVLKADKRWLIEHGFQQVVTYLLHSSEFNQALGVVYMKLLAHGRHQGLVVGYKACEDVLESLSKKRSCSGDSEETMSAGDEASKEGSLEASEAASEGWKKKKVKKSKDDGVGASKPSGAGFAETLKVSVDGC